jgi:divalent metal cation (Fe/Co/Zn/Cd) transporter
LMDAVDPAVVDQGEAALLASPGVERVTRLRIRWVGHRLQADAELEVDAAVSLAEAHQIAHTAEDSLATVLPKLASAVVHAYPPGHSRPDTSVDSSGDPAHPAH